MTSQNEEPMSSIRSETRRSIIDTALARLAGGDISGSEAAFKKILHASPHDSEALHGLACVARACKKPSLAIGLAGKALQDTQARDEQRARFHLTLGLALAECAHHEAARGALVVSTLLEPRDPRAYAALAESLLQLGRLEDAFSASREAIALASDDIGYRQNYAEILLKAGSLQEAVEIFADIARICPGNGAAQANLGAALFEVGALDEARKALLQSDRNAPNVPQTLNNLGLVDMALGDLDQACEVLRHANALTPDDARIRNNYGTVLLELGRSNEAEHIFRSLMNGKGKEAEQARFNLGTLELAQGRMRDGWRNFEARLDLRGMQDELPRWNGGGSEGPVAIHAEQGLGDLVQFLRFLPEAARRAPLRLHFPDSARDLLCMMPDLAPLLGNRVQWSESAEQSCSIMSLPFLLGCDVPSDAPYLQSDVAVIPKRIGLAWAGNPTYRFDARRSLSRAMIEPLLQTEGCTFLCLQRDASADERRGMMSLPLSDLREAAEAVASCALVISVDSLMVHLAGALGRPTWLLNRFGGDWRWRGPSWYRTVDEYQVSQAGTPEATWPPLIERVAKDLRRWSGRML